MNLACKYKKHFLLKGFLINCVCVCERQTENNQYIWHHIILTLEQMILVIVWQKFYFILFYKTLWTPKERVIRRMIREINMLCINGDTHLGKYNLVENSREKIQKETLKISNRVVNLIFMKLKKKSTTPPYQTTALIKHLKQSGFNI